MKKSFFYLVALLLASFSTQNLQAQALGCGSGRYFDSEFISESDVVKTSAIVFGSNRAVGTSSNQTLRLNFYEPANDTASKRPLVIFAFGGSFITGDREQVDPFCVALTKMGYVCAAIDYRIGFFLPNEVNTTLAVVRGMHDMKAAVRFFRKEAANYKIDTDRIIVGGVSAGAITAVHTAYLDENAEIPSYLYGDTTGLGGVEGVSGNPGFSSKVAAVINFSGAIGDTNWVQPGDAPMIGVHDNGDNVVPYDTREVSVSGIPTGLIASGSRDLHARLKNLSIRDTLWTVISNGHVSYVNDQADLDTTLKLTKNFLYNEVTCKQTPTGIVNKSLKDAEVNLYPNPTNGELFIESLVTGNKAYDVSVFDATGKLVFESNEKQIQKINLEQISGIYRVNIRFEDSQYKVFSKNIIIQ